MKKILTLGLLLTLAGSPLARAEHESDCKFLENAAEASLIWNVIGALSQTNSTNFTLPAGGLSLTNATNILILGLGRQLVTNHATLYSNAFVLQQTNGCEGVTNVDRNGLEALRRLSGLVGTPFDMALLEYVIESTLEAIEDAQKAALEGETAAVRAFARQQLAALNAQLVAALAAGESVLGGDFDDIGDGDDGGNNGNNGNHNGHHGNNGNNGNHNGNNGNRGRGH
jgi:hypothetical protein